MQKICLIQTAVSSISEAKIIASGLVDGCMAGCVQISGPGLSTYRWNGKVEHTEEYYLSIKTKPACRDDVISWLKQHHPYELPEIIWAEFGATEDYAGWLNLNVIHTATV
ncbi:MAG: divalent-cation tolerance protein CutA [Mariprofundus sp.]|nr:divalent-cation tolerance protein CutA [Mariprofundus sp.]